jgi:hypothetical protein
MSADTKRPTATASTVEAVLATIAKETLGIETLETRQRDALTTTSRSGR